MKQEIVRNMLDEFENKTGRKITEVEKECITMACLVGENYGLKKMVEVIKQQPKEENKIGRLNYARYKIIRTMSMWRKSNAHGKREH